jgi:ABC-type multidrug transport system ATPase subunit
MITIEQLVWQRSGSGAGGRTRSHAYSRQPNSGSRFTLHIPRMTLGSGITLVVGRNGAGKSSLLHLLGTAELPDTGQVVYDGLTVDRSLPAIRAAIGFVPTGVELYEEMTVLKLLRYLGQLKGAVPGPGIGASAGADAGETIEQIIAAFRLEPYRDRKIKMLAQGIRQRIALAQAWLGKPRYLFLDEPLNALDSLERLSFIRLLAGYASTRAAIVSTHELGEWEAWAHRIVWLDNGKLRYHGPVSEWVRGLPAAVWEGWVSVSQQPAFDKQSVISLRAEDDGFRLRIMGTESPGPGFARLNPSMEDAYFIRCRYEAPNTAG